MSNVKTYQRLILWPTLLVKYKQCENLPMTYRVAYSLFNMSNVKTYPRFFILMVQYEQCEDLPTFSFIRTVQYEQCEDLPRTYCIPIVRYDQCRFAM